MSFTLQKNSLLLLGVIAVVCTRGVLLLFKDPEGPNLLIVVGMAGVIFVLSLFVYTFPLSNIKKFILAIFAQTLLLGTFYLLFK